MHPHDFIAPGASAATVTVIFMFKMYLDRRRTNGHAANEQVRKLRRELHDRERKEEMKLLSDAIGQLTIAIKEMHASHQIQVKILEGMSQKIA